MGTSVLAFRSQRYPGPIVCRLPDADRPDCGSSVLGPRVIRRRAKHVRLRYRYSFWRTWRTTPGRAGGDSLPVPSSSHSTKEAAELGFVLAQFDVAMCGIRMTDSGECCRRPFEAGTADGPEDGHSPRLGLTDPLPPRSRGHRRLPRPGIEPYFRACCGRGEVGPRASFRSFGR